MKIYNIKKTNGLTIEEIFNELNKGGKFVTYGYCISIVAMTFRLASSPYFIKSDEPIAKYRLKYNILSLLFGWWGLPHGPIYTIDMLKINLKNGGIDIGEDIIPKINLQHPIDKHKLVLINNLTIEFNDDELIK